MLRRMKLAPHKIREAREANELTYSELARRIAKRDEYHLGTTSGGQREFAPVLARAACAVGVHAVFIETHQDPDNAPSDGPNMIPIDALAPLLQTLVRFDRIAKGTACSADATIRQGPMRGER